MNLKTLATDQEELSNFVKRYDEPQDIGTVVTGVDVSYSDSIAFGCAVVSDITTREIIYSTTVTSGIESEYIPGFFQLREGPILIKLLQRLKVPSGIVLIDGNGILHPRRFGLASYVGLTMNLQTVGVAKKLMLGELGVRSGNTADIIHEDELLGRALWMNKKRPIYISIGHRVSLETAVQIVRNSCIEGYPEVLRQAHRLSRELLDDRED
ncbi:MAG: endonuclease V [Candidatus Thorarchaeota archaeon]|nr:endonuclease V [Candidatus Thorarchaeota archaeon]